ncbi:MAG TPA: periplasmic heavy metal sensor, partial [Rhodocyclaceae bacterium]|nr:periplasmic heavy metal sensor [Rhodocyclaceae bacterium]
MRNRTDWQAILKPLAAAALITLAAGAMAPAQAEPGGGPGACRTSLGGHDRPGPMGFGGFGDESGPLLRGLDLSDEQRDRIFELRHAQEPRQREQMKQLRASREALQALSRADSFDAAQARTLADQHAKAVGAMAL